MKQKIRAMVNIKVETKEQIGSEKSVEVAERMK